MLKYMKYEIKGSYKFILGIIAIVVLASTFIQFNMYNEYKMNVLGMPAGPMGGFTGFMLFISIVVILGSFLVAFFHIIGSFRKELYEDSGYLTFILPLTGNQILGAKFLVALLWFTVIGLTISLYNLLIAIKLYNSEGLAEIMKEVIAVVSPGFLSVLVTITLSAIATLVLIYLSMALSKVSVKNKQIGGLWFIIFLILNSISGYLTVKISAAVPYFLNMKNFSLAHYKNINISGSDIEQLILYGNNLEAYLNLTAIIISMAITVLAFIATGYIIEKKIDL